MSKNIFFRILCAVVCISVIGFAFCACDENGSHNDVTPTSPETSTAASASSSEAYGEHPHVLFTMENGESFLMELYPEYAPLTVENFLGLVNEGFYDGLEFHRIVEGFMAQGGASAEKQADSIYGEFASNGYPQNTLMHTRGVVSMARTNNPDSASSQFFICYSSAQWLDGQYAAFGKVTAGMETVDSFLDIPRAYNSSGELAVPIEPVVIESAVQVD